MTDLPTRDQLIAEHLEKLDIAETAALDILDHAGTPRLRARANATLERVRTRRRKLLGTTR